MTNFFLGFIFKKNSKIESLREEVSSVEIYNIALIAIMASFVIAIFQIIPRLRK